MPERFTYLAVDFFCLLFPLIFSFHPKIKFHKQVKQALLPMVVAAVIFIVWDMLFTKLNVWSFNPNYTCGVFIYNLPIEEILFFICIPYACIFSYHCFKIFFKLDQYLGVIKIFYLFLAIILAIIGFLHLSKWYTSVTFIALSAYLFYLLITKSNFLSTFFFCYLFVLIPFFISNGILTGGFINRIVVAYNPEYNLNIRLYTIPIEDIFYGMLLLLLNVGGFELLQKRKN